MSLSQLGVFLPIDDYFLFTDCKLTEVSKIWSKLVALYCRGMGWLYIELERLVCQCCHLGCCAGLLSTTFHGNGNVHWQMPMHMRKCIESENQLKELIFTIRFHHAFVIYFWIFGFSSCLFWI